MKARFLFFLYYYPPAQGTAPKRNHLIASEISRRAAFSEIFTSSIRQVSDQDDMKIHSIPTFDYRYYLRKKTDDGALPEEKKRRMQFLIRFINTFPFNIIIGEGGLFYLWKLIRKGQRSIRQNGITYVYSSYRPFTDHYAAYILKRRNPGIYWIADFRDLVIDPHYNHLYFPRLHHRILQRIYKRADLLTTVSQGLARQLYDYNPNVIPVKNGIRNIPQEILPIHCKFFKIAYTGSMFLDKRNAKPLFAALRELIDDNRIDESDLQVIYAGKDGQTWSDVASEFLLDQVLILKGIIPHDEAVKLQKSACINILLTISSPELQGVLTGKIIEYFEAGSPVLSIVVNHNDPELIAILNELEIGSSFSDQPDDVNGIKDFIYSEYLYWKRNGTNRKPVKLDVLQEKYSVEATMKPFFEKIFQP